MIELFRKISQYGFRKSFDFAWCEIKKLFINRFVLGSYSQDKEDLIIDKLFSGKKKGFYLDIGASDPVRFSNTNRFYRKGWGGG